MRFKKPLVLYVVLMILLASPLMPGKKAESESKIPDYSLTERKDIPVEYTWQVEDLYPSIEAWEKEKTAVVEMMGRIDSMSKDWTSSPQKMLAFLKLIDEIQLKGSKLYQYSSLNSDEDMSDPTFQQMKGQMRNLFVQYSAKLSFIDTDVLNLGKEKFELYLQKESGLKPYAFGMEKILRTKDHVLPPEQQRIVSLTGLFSQTAGKAANLLNDVDLPKPEVTLADGKKVVLNYPNFAIYRAAKNPADRALVVKTYWENHKQFENTLAALFDGGMKRHYFYAQTHKYKDCLEAKLFADNIDPAVYHKLIKSVRENLEPLHHYIKLKQELLGLDKFKYEDIYASAVKNVDKKYTYDEGRQIILKMMKVLGKDYIDGLQEAFEKRWIDRYPNKNKETGAYSSTVYSIHPFIKMNYDGTYNNLSTLAHELGHALHSYFSNKTQHYANADYPSFLAEIASTFNENVLMDYLLKNEKDDLFKLYILDAYMQQVKGTVYRQTKFAEFELAMHRHVEAGNTLTPQWLNNKYLELTRFYYGHDKGITEVDDYIQNEWSAIPHFFLNYYVYTYSTGMIASTALTHMVFNGKDTEREKYLDFLKAGGSRYPLDTLKLAGVDMTTSKPYEAAFKRFKYLLSEMEKIVTRLKKDKKI